MHYDCILFLFTYLMVDLILVQYFGHYPGGFQSPIAGSRAWRPCSLSIASKWLSILQNNIATSRGLTKHVALVVLKGKLEEPCFAGSEYLA
jgi:hypothetical protein